MTTKTDHFPMETLRRFEHVYLPHFETLIQAGKSSFSVSELAADCDIDERQVRREMASLTGSGELRREYKVSEVVHEIRRFLGYENCHDVALIGAGRIARALLANRGFEAQGFNISLLFDTELETEGQLDGERLMPLSHLADVAERMHLHLGIIATEPRQAQKAADALVAAGILAIWNVSGAKVELPQHILIAAESFGADEDIAGQQAIALTLRSLKQSLQKNLGWAE